MNKTKVFAAVMGIPAEAIVAIQRWIGGRYGFNASLDGSLSFHLKRTAVRAIRNGDHYGVVTDSTGATMNGVKILVRDPDTGFSRETVTNETGNFNMPGLRPSSYDLTAEIAGFRRYSMKEFRVEIDQTARLDIKMEIGQVAEQIEVKGTAQLLHTENATVGAVIEQRRILELPLNGRNFAALALLAPGVNSGAPGTSTVEG